MLAHTHSTTTHHYGAAGKDASVKAALLDHDVLAHDEPVSRHFFQLWKNSVDVVVGINERDYDRQLAASFDEVRSVDFAASEETGYGMEYDGTKNIFFAQVFQNFEMQRTMMPGIALGYVDSDLNGHDAPSTTVTLAFYSARANAAPAITAAKESTLLPTMLMAVSSHWPRSMSAKLS